MDIKKSSFGHLPNGSEVFQYVLTNDAGMQVDIITYGAIIRAIHVPDRHGIVADVVLGYDNLQQYYDDRNYIGAVIGRYANRIAAARFELDGSRYALNKNDGDNHLHGGVSGFHKVLWSAAEDVQAQQVSLTLQYRSPDGEQGYPGNLDVRVRYELSQDNELTVQYQASTDQATPVNLTQHSYFNLAGSPTILAHRLMICADAYTPVDRQLLPAAAHSPVAQTPFDFRSARAIGAQIGERDAQLQFGQGYDHNFVLNKSGPQQPELAARVCDPDSGRQLDICTTEPGLQFYSGNFLNGTLTGKNRVFSHRFGFCLEPQHFPDSPNRSDFPNSVLRPAELYSTSTVYRFSVQK